MSNAIAIAGRVVVWADDAPRPQLPVRCLDEELTPWVPPTPKRGRKLKATRTAERERERHRHKKDREKARLATAAAQAVRDLALVEAAKEALATGEALPVCVTTAAAAGGTAGGRHEVLRGCLAKRHR